MRSNCQQLSTLLRRQLSPWNWDLLLCQGGVAYKRRMGDYLRGAPATDHTWDSPLHYFKQQFLEAIDLICSKVKERFSSVTLSYPCSIEDLVINCANGEDPEFRDKLTEQLDVIGIWTSNVLKFSWLFSQHSLRTGTGRSPFSHP